MLTSLLLTLEREEKVRTHSEFITLIGKVLNRLFHTFVPARGNP